MKKEKPEEQPKVEEESMRSQEELAPPPTPEPDVDPNEELELSAGEEDAPEEKNGETVRLVLTDVTHIVAQHCHIRARRWGHFHGICVLKWSRLLNAIRNTEGFCLFLLNVNLRPLLC